MSGEFRAALNRPEGPDAFERITGVDISPDQTRRATRQAKEAGQDDTLSFRVADARQALCEAEGQYDVVLALNALHHFSHLEETMRLIARALRPGGLLIMDEYVGPQGSSGPARRCGPRTRCSPRFRTSNGSGATAGSSAG